jgi:cyclic lactone autoinducer peptide
MKNKNLSKKISKIVAFASRLAITSNVNSNCEFWAHQPKLPKNAKKLRKF